MYTKNIKHEKIELLPFDCDSFRKQLEIMKITLQIQNDIKISMSFFSFLRLTYGPPLVGHQYL